MDVLAGSELSASFVVAVLALFMVLAWLLSRVAASHADHPGHTHRESRRDLLPPDDRYRMI